MKDERGKGNEERGERKDERGGMNEERGTRKDERKRSTFLVPPSAFTWFVLDHSVETL